MSHFYLILPSNSSMNYYPENTVAKYKTHLVQPISLEGDWEVRLYECEYQRTWYNVDEIDSMIQFHRTTEDERNIGEWIHIPQGYYADITDLVNKINAKLSSFGTQRGLAQVPQLKFDKYTNKMSIQIMRGMKLVFSNCMNFMLGVAETDEISTLEPVGTVTLTNTCDVDRNCRSLYVYCDILKHIVVGDTKARLLRNINVSGKQGSVIRNIFEKPMYVPVQKKHFQSIEIDIRSEFGDSVPFVNGKSLMTLHFRIPRSPRSTWSWTRQCVEWIV